MGPGCYREVGNVRCKVDNEGDGVVVDCDYLSNKYDDCFGELLNKFVRDRVRAFEWSCIPVVE